MQSGRQGRKQFHLCAAVATIDPVRVSCPGILAPAVLLHLDVIKGADAFVNCGGSSRKTIKRLGRTRQDNEEASNFDEYYLTEVEVETQQVTQHQ